MRLLIWENYDKITNMIERWGKIGSIGHGDITWRNEVLETIALCDEASAVALIRQIWVGCILHGDLDNHNGNENFSYFPYLSLRNRCWQTGHLICCRKLQNESETKKNTHFEIGYVHFRPLRTDYEFENTEKNSHSGHMEVWIIQIFPYLDVILYIFPRPKKMSCKYFVTWAKRICFCILSSNNNQEVYWSVVNVWQS